MGLDEADGLILVGWMSICWYNFAHLVWLGYKDGFK